MQASKHLRRFFFNHNRKIKIRKQLKTKKNERSLCLKKIREKERLQPIHIRNSFALALFFFYFFVPSFILKQKLIATFSYNRNHISYVLLLCVCVRVCVLFHSNYNVYGKNKSKNSSFALASITR